MLNTWVWHNYWYSYNTPNDLVDYYFNTILSQHTVFFLGTCFSGTCKLLLRLLYKVRWSMQGNSGITTGSIKYKLLCDLYSAIKERLSSSVSQCSNKY